ncbi:MAG: hypothetical protein JST11_22695 [Acidobacteria bacterium]|nr:hypothetical protein [Acidobacteriota bacterium]
MRIVLLVASVALGCTPTVAFADLVHMTLGSPTTPHPYGVFVDPYPISVTDSSGATANLLLACDDYETEIGVGHTWDANRYLLGALNTVSGTTPKFNNAPTTWSSAALGAGTVTGLTVQNLYDAVAVLTVDLLFNQANRTIDSYAIWSIFDPSHPPQGVAPGADAKAYNTLLAVKDKAPTYLYNHVYIYTPVPLVASQEFIGYVPDGGMTLMLLGGALVSLETLRIRFGV